MTDHFETLIRDRAAALAEQDGDPAVTVLHVLAAVGHCQIELLKAKDQVLLAVAGAHPGSEHLGRSGLPAPEPLELDPEVVEPAPESDEAEQLAGETAQTDAGETKATVAVPKSAS